MKDFLMMLEKVSNRVEPIAHFLVIIPPEKALIANNAEYIKIRTKSAENIAGCCAILT